MYETDFNCQLAPLQGFIFTFPHLFVRDKVKYIYAWCDGVMEKDFKC